MSWQQGKRETERTRPEDMQGLWWEAILKV